MSLFYDTVCHYFMIPIEEKRKGGASPYVRGAPPRMSGGRLPVCHYFMIPIEEKRKQQYV